MVPEGFRKVPGRFSGRDCDIKKTQGSGRFPEGSRKISRKSENTQGAAADLLQPRSAGEGKTTAGEPQENAKNVAGNFPEDFRKISGRFPEEQPPAATPRSAWRQSDAVNKERANLRPNSLLLWFDFMQNVALRIANLELGDMF